MESPKSDGNSVEACAASSPSAQKSPFSKFLNNLSPIKSARASRYTQRLSESSFPTTPLVFSSPHLDLHQETSFLKREEIAASSSQAHGKCYSPSNSAPIPCNQKHLQSCSPSDFVGECLADPLKADRAQNAERLVQSATDVPLLPSCFTASEVTIGKVDVTNDVIIEVGAQTLPHLAKKHLLSGSLCLVQVSDDQSIDERSDKISEFSSENICDHVESDDFLEHNEASQHQRGIRRHLQFEATLDCKCDAAFNCHTSSGPGTAVPEVGDHVVIDHQSSEAVVVVNGGHLPDNIELPWDSQKVSCFDQQTLSCNGKMPGQQFADRVEEPSQCQDSSKGKRQRETYTDESEGCKLCNCKRSKCLKLYCECFAAGIYCVDYCACENCFNKPEYEDTVLDIRQQIELRNPLAFAPAVVKQANDSPNVADDGNSMTPSSARHKRGCKCKRSKCLKKYCECFRAKVGCSDGCRCEDCENSFGKKSEPIFQREKKLKNLSHEKLNTAEIMSGSIKGGTANQFSPTWEELVDISHPTPLSHSHSRAVPSLTSPNLGDCPNDSQAQSQKGSGLQLSPGYLHWCSSALSRTQGCVSNVSRELDSTSALCDIMGDGSPEILMENSNPTNIVKAGSPNQKRVSSTASII
ncbi:protein tesmin/TSO1-like CXC 3 [Durio zibethinus]|uniref:Protein tesmin/TSO1-like CXC 3 n=1 Tax=Durio zibethinus TaxID=66656 RepID=A0A6P5X6Q4_DURZI|nr:protein tesmin/TSO1-like CXC 3 [Durio zibethinus]